MGKKKEKIYLSFGHNAEQVTGSYVHINYDNCQSECLVDYGMVQENCSLAQLYRINGKRPKFKPSKLNYVFLTHAHIDHCGLIPLLYKWGCEAPLIIPQGSKKLIEAMLLDSANICTRDAKDLSRRGGEEVSPLFEESDVMKALSYIQEYPMGERITLSNSLSFEFRENGHILYSASIIFWLTSGSSHRKIMVTGDLGNITCPQKYVQGTPKVESCNVLIGESTYGNKARTAKSKDRKLDLDKIKTYINTFCIEGKGRALIPVFSLGRSVSMLTVLYELYKDDPEFDIPVIFASPLGIKLLNIYLEELPEDQRTYLQKVVEWKNLKILQTFEELEAEMQSKKPMIFCLPSGMMNAGYSRYAATQILPHSRDLIIFCGFSAEGTLARKIKEKNTKSITIEGKSIPARCQVTSVKSFSSHAQYQDLLKIYSDKEANIDKILLVHGDYKNKIEFARELEEQLERDGKNTRVIATSKDYTLSL